MSLVLIHTVLSNRSQTGSSVKISEYYKYDGILQERDSECSHACPLACSASLLS